MNEPAIVAIKQVDLSASSPLTAQILLLNNAHAQELSWLDAAGLRHLVQQASVAWRIAAVDAFLLAFDQACAYDNTNFQWFRARYDHFLYIDRVVVAESARGRGYARYLYRKLFAFAAEQGHQQIVCEVNLNPPNPGSDAFHASMAFTQVGTAEIHGGTKTVQYLKRDLPGE
jgi:uncharacterized protein